MNTTETKSLNDIASRLQRLTLPSSIMLRSRAPADESNLDRRFPMSYSSSPKELNHIIDTPHKQPMHDLSPTSTESSDSSSQSSDLSASRSSFEGFFITRSRVVRLYNLPHMSEAFVSALFLPQTHLRRPIPTPLAMWTLKDEYCGIHSNSIWAVYKTHEEASLALCHSNPAISITTALESELEPYSKLRRFISNIPVTLRSPGSYQRSVRTSASHPAFQTPEPESDRISVMVGGDYTISSNPPNPRTSFRLGDWICSSPKCAAHNFGRNLACIGCGCPRSGNGGSPPQSLQNPPARAPSSPRFASFSSQPTSLPSIVQPAQQQQMQHPANYGIPQPSSRNQVVYTPPAAPPKSSPPLLTPSGRAFAIGGRVQNISSDPLSPCIMYWPDNEPFPEQGQIRPGNLVGVPQPPILNTGNRGPISHQPGDWVCLKCNYLNWRRRKVCQTCLPYAEGNGDSISTAVQAERIALLTSVLTQTQSTMNENQMNHCDRPQPPSPQGSSSPSPLQQQRPATNTSTAQTRAFLPHLPPQNELCAEYANIRPIYQTSGYRRPSPLYSTGPDFHNLPVHTPAPLLPSFLQDIVQSPTLSPASTASADLSSEEYDDLGPLKTTFPRTHSGDDSAADSPFGNIWRLDGEECKSLSAFALPNRQELIGAGKHERDAPRLHFPSP